MARKTSKFTIDDAFDETLDDVVVRVYGSTTIDRSSFNGRPKTLSNEPLTSVRVDRTCTNSAASPHVACPNPVLLNFKTGILSEDVSCMRLYPESTVMFVR